MTTEEFKEFIDKGGLSITIKRHVPYKCISSWEPDWFDGICLVEDSVTTAGNNHHPHAKSHHIIPETKIDNVIMKKISDAITKIIQEENVEVK